MNNTAINMITVILAVVFLLPILAGILRQLTSARIQNSLLSVFSFIGLLIGLLLSVYLARIIFGGEQNSFLTALYKLVPSIEESVENQDIWAYIIGFFILLFVINSIWQLLAIPMHRFIIVPISDFILSRLKNPAAQRIIGGLWQLPKALVLVTAFSLMLNLYSVYAKNASLGQYINSSRAYQLVNSKILEPVMSAVSAEEIPLLFKESINNAVENISPEMLPVIAFYNGVTLAEAVKSNDEINVAAKQIIGDEADEVKKSYLLYQWIADNIEYDDNKAKIVSASPSAVNSGAIEAFATKSGVCFDFSCLYIAMCRAVDLKVRFITGQGYSGTEWGSHSWNQVYSAAEDRWINVDTTFAGSGGDYFDNADFFDNHSDAGVQGEWL